MPKIAPEKPQLITTLGVIMQRSEKWKYPTWSMNVVIETNARIDVYELLQGVESLHQNGIGYSCGYSDISNEVTFYAYKPKYLASQLFSQAIKKLGKNSQVKSVKTTKLVNLFHENMRLKST